MAIKDALLRLWRGDPNPGSPEGGDGGDERLSRADRAKLIDQYHENETAEPPRIPAAVDNLPPGL
jgi:hypothetical protein